MSTNTLFPWRTLAGAPASSFVVATFLNCVHLAVYTAVVTLVVKVIA